MILFGTNHSSNDPLKFSMRLRIKEIREAKGLNQEEVADMANISRPYLANIENGLRTPNALRIDAIARALDVTPFQLIDDQSVSPQVSRLMSLVIDLSEDDMAAVVRHAEALLMQGRPERSKQ